VTDAPTGTATEPGATSTESTATTEPPARPRPARRRPTELTFELDDRLVEAVAAAEPEWLAADRRAALAQFRALPIESNQLYTPYVDLRTADLADVRPYEQPAGAPEEGASDVPSEGASGIAEFREDTVAALALDGEAREAGVRLVTLGTLVRDDPALARELLADESTLPADDRLAQLTRAAWNQGVALIVPDGVRLSRPVILRWRAGAPGRALLTRTIVQLGAGASVSLLEELVPSGIGGQADQQALFTGSLELHVGAGAELDVTSLQEFAPRQVVFQHRTSRLGEAAQLRLALAQLGGRLVRSRVDNRLDGDRSSARQVEIVFGADDQVFDLTSYTRHVGRDTTGDLLSKGVLLDASRSYMKGLITIEKSARGTDSFLGEFGMNLSRKTRAVAIPSLEIDQPDCRRAAHSSSVGPIDEGQVFYLQSRGIATDEARKFIVLGFLEPVVARVPLPDAEGRLRDLLDAKWDASFGAEPEGSAAA
jgi:Fe-S cluster assembly scaffold protein SufB